MFGKKKQTPETPVQSGQVKAGSQSADMNKLAAQQLDPALVAKVPPKPNGEVPVKASVVSEGTLVKGFIEAKGPLHFLGHIEGEVKAPQVSLGASAKLKGRIHCEQLSLHGRIDGEIHCRELVVGRTAHIQGSVHCESIALETGATLNGDIQVK